jgi:hypothetical protein
MNGFIKRTMTGAYLGGLVALAGCCGVDKKLPCDCYDNCWPNRYNYQAAMSVNAAFGAQVFNGHILDQTIWTYMFKTSPEGAATAELTPDGLQHLSYLTRRRPCPDPHVWLQTAQDVVYDPEHPEKLAADRAKLDTDRREAILRYLNAETAARQVAWTVDVHDAPTPGYFSTPYGIAVQKHYNNFQGALPINAVGAAGTGASTPR